MVPQKPEYSTPISFDANNSSIMSSELLSLSSEEMSSFVSNFARFTNIKLSDGFLPLLKRLTSGNIGFCHMLLRRMESLKSEGALKDYVDSYKWHNDVVESRALAGVRQQIIELPLSCVQLLRRLIFHGQIQQTESNFQDINRLLFSQPS